MWNYSAEQKLANSVSSDCFSGYRASRRLILCKEKSNVSGECKSSTDPIRNSGPSEEERLPNKGKTNSMLREMK